MASIAMVYSPVYPVTLDAKSFLTARYISYPRYLAEPEVRRSETRVSANILSSTCEVSKESICWLLVQEVQVPDCLCPILHCSR